MSSSILQRNGGALLVVLAVTGAAVACGGGEQTERPATPAVSTRPCHTPPDSIVGLATLQFMKHISPKPHRYLIPVGTDLALPVGSQWALQTSAATLNMWPRDTAQQRKVKEQVGKNGALTMLLVNYHGRRTLPDGRVAMDYSGQYIGGDVDGKPSLHRDLFSFHAEGERFGLSRPLRRRDRTRAARCADAFRGSRSPACCSSQPGNGSDLQAARSRAWHAGRRPTWCFRLPFHCRDHRVAVARNPGRAVFPTACWSSNTEARGLIILLCCSSPPSRTPPSEFSGSASPGAPADRHRLHRGRADPLRTTLRQQIIIAAESSRLLGGDGADPGARYRAGVLEKPEATLAAYIDRLLLDWPPVVTDKTGIPKVRCRASAIVTAMLGSFADAGSYHRGLCRARRRPVRVRCLRRRRGVLELVLPDQQEHLDELVRAAHGGARLPGAWGVRVADRRSTNHLVDAALPDLRNQSALRLRGVRYLRPDDLFPGARPVRIRDRPAPDGDLPIGLRLVLPPKPASLACSPCRCRVFLPPAPGSLPKGDRAESLIGAMVRGSPAAESSTVLAGRGRHLSARPTNVWYASPRAPPWRRPSPSPSAEGTRVPFFPADDAHLLPLAHWFEPLPRSRPLPFFWVPNLAAEVPSLPSCARARSSRRWKVRRAATYPAIAATRRLARCAARPPTEPTSAPALATDLAAMVASQVRGGRWGCWWSRQSGRHPVLDESG